MPFCSAYSTSIFSYCSVALPSSHRWHLYSLQLLHIFRFNFAAATIAFIIILCHFVADRLPLCFIHCLECIQCTNYFAVSCLFCIKLIANEIHQFVKQILFFTHITTPQNSSLRAFRTYHESCP